MGRDPSRSLSATPLNPASSFKSVQSRINKTLYLDWFRDRVNLPELLSLFRIPAGNNVLLSFMGWLLPTRSRRPAAAAQERRMKQATVEVKSFTSIVCRDEKQQLLLQHSTASVSHRDNSNVSSGSHQTDIWICFPLFFLSRLKDTRVFFFPQ